MFEVLERSEVEKQQTGHYFTIGHLAGAISALFAATGQFFEVFELLSKFFAKIVGNTENFGNFVVGKHS